VIVELEQNLGKQEEVKGGPKAFLDLYVSVLRLHQHEIAQSALVRRPDQ